MTYPRGDLASRAHALGNLCYDALDLPDVPEPRRALLQAIREFARAHSNPAWNLRHTPLKGSAAEASLERQLQALKAVEQEGRRVPQPYDAPSQNAAADGTGQPVPVPHTG